MDRTGGLSVILARATGQHAGSWVVGVIILAWSVVAHFVGSGEEVSGTIWLRVLAVIASALPVLVCLVVLSIVPVEARPLRRAILVFSVFLVASAIRGALLPLTLYWLGLTESVTVAFRLPVGIVNTMLGLCFSSYVVGTFLEFSARLREVNQRREALTETIGRASIDQARTDSLGADRVRRIVMGEFVRLVGSPRERVLNQLRAMVDDIVRPLSHDLANTVTTWSPSLGSAGTPVSWGEVWRRMPLSRGIRSRWIIGFALVLMPPVSFRAFGPETALLVAACIPVGVPLGIALARRLFSTALDRAGGLMRVPILTFALAVAGLPGSIAYAILIADRVDPFAFIAAAMVVAPIFAAMPVLARSARFAIENAEEEIAALERQLAWAIARANLESWQRQGDLGRALHGPVQGAIHAAIHRIGTAVESKAETDRLIRQLGLELDGVLGRLDALDGQAPDLVEEVGEARALWAGLAELSLTATPEALAALASDSVITGFINDVVQEHLSNAIRHGLATIVDIELERSGLRTMRVSVSDDGVGIRDASNPGLGTKLLESCSMSWSRSRVDGRTRVEAVFPFIPGPDAPAFAFPPGDTPPKHSLASIGS